MKIQDQFLMIDRIVSKATFHKESTASAMKKVANGKPFFTEEYENAIDHLFQIVDQNDVFCLVSVSTPMEFKTPYQLDLLFDFYNLEESEKCEISVEHIVYLRNYILPSSQTGHHCLIVVRVYGEIPSLFSKLPVDNYQQIVLGACNYRNWELIKKDFIQSRSPHFEKE
ncbi:MAG: hypothetical protein EOO46_22625 [Flavobacterium sp.]|nr:MAG: hypothetical protein EOO46_22625 [Flavobacterium sp.]